MEEEIRRLTAEKGLEKEVTFCGYRKPFEVREMMEQTEVYLITSDYKEGWGAVLNEAMNSGCAVVTSHAIGAAPFLIRHGENGLVFQSGDLNDLEKQTERLIKSEAERRKLGAAAYETIRQEWNAEKAAGRLVKMAEALLGGKIPAGETVVQNIESLAYEAGPLSVAEVISPGRMYGHLTGN